MKILVRRLLARLGLQVQFKLKVSKRDRADPNEVRALERDLSLLATLANSNELITEEAGAPTVWDAKKVRSYLDDHRILLFHNVIRAARESGVGFARNSVADVGSGTGYLLRLIAASDPSRLVGYDSYRALNVVASVICPTADIVFHDLFADPPERHDVVFCMETLEHQVDPAAAVLQLISYVKPGGTLIITVPDGRVDTAESVGKYPGGTGYYGHVNFWSIESFQHFLEKTLGGGFKVATRRVGPGDNLFASVTFRSDS